jgi:putative phosphoesterase
MTRIGLISDTHIPDNAKELPEQVKQVFRDVDLILHAGDIYITSVLDELECLAPVLAAEGDGDGADVISDKRVKGKHVLTIDGATIWLMHSKPSSWPSVSEENSHLASLRYDKPPNILVFGHTHDATIERKGDVLLVNPGSPTFPQYRYELGTVALLTINSGKAEARIVQLR